MDGDTLAVRLERFGIGLERGALALSAYSLEWAEAFQFVEQTIRPAIGDARVWHVGSTAIPGCMAKPILDLCIGYDDSTDFISETRGLEALGFTSLGEHGIPGRSYFCLFDAEERISYIHIHAYAGDHDEVEAHVAFRDALRRDADTVAAYNALKRELIASGISRKDYPEAKTDFIRSVLARDVA